MKQKQEKKVKIKVIDRKAYVQNNPHAQQPISDPTVILTNTVTLFTGI